MTILTLKLNSYIFCQNVENIQHSVLAVSHNYKYYKVLMFTHKYIVKSGDKNVLLQVCGWFIAGGAEGVYV
jgi:hypothetical protein